METLASCPCSKATCPIYLRSEHVIRWANLLVYSDCLPLQSLGEISELKPFIFIFKFVCNQLPAFTSGFKTEFTQQRQASPLPVLPTLLA